MSISNISISPRIAAKERTWSVSSSEIPPICFNNIGIIFVFLRGEGGRVVNSTNFVCDAGWCYEAVNIKLVALKML